MDRRVARRAATALAEGSAGGPPPWSIDADGALAALASTRRGLTAAEAALRLARHGPNALPADRPLQAWRLLARQFASPLVLLLVAASGISFALGEHIQTTIIVVMVALGGLLAFVQEYRSERAVRALGERLVHHATVRRDGATARLDARALVLGDVVELVLGSVVPADVRLIEVDDLEIDESTLTGESRPVAKRVDALPGPCPMPQDQANVAFHGTAVVRGAAAGVVFATGGATELGRTATLLTARRGPTSFEQGIDRFGRFLLQVTLALTAIVCVALGVLHGDWAGSLLFALALAVGIAPELLPVIVTVNLAHGALAMSRRHVLVKRLAAIEDLGNADILCTDKTGTLTMGRQRVTGAIDAAGRSDATPLAWARLCLATGSDGGATNPIDQAILDAAPPEGRPVPAAPSTDGVERLATVAFDFHRRRMSVVVRPAGADARWLIVKGAAAEVLAVCQDVAVPDEPTTRTLDGGMAAELRTRHADLEAAGHQVIAVARRAVPPQEDYGAGDERDLSLIGFVLIGDAPKATAPEAVAALGRLGVRVVVLTGDTAAVADHVCRQIGLVVRDIVPGETVDTLDDAQLARRAESADVYARVTPAQKLRVIDALRAGGHTVAYMGDGVNDAPALRAADVGISFDTATEVAREAASVILLERDLGVVANGIREGRRTFVNTRTYLLATISSNFGNMLTVAGAALLLPFIPLLPVHVLLLNLVSDLPMLAIATDRVADEDLARPTRWDVDHIAGAMYFFGTISSMADYATFALLLWVVRADMVLFRTGWFIESLLTELVIIFLLRRYGPSWRSRPSRALVAAALLTLGLTWLLFRSALLPALGLTVPSARLVAAIVVVVGGYAVLTEAGKVAFRRLRPNDPGL
ncbi:MAG: magnesium-translocating P-type ATPase [Ardenticatenales bacterium]|jgi:Mg2+-importing ATPase|nr:magnesium-translocating P-type ATPase [Ardenticatenales bacterium]